MDTDEKRLPEHILPTASTMLGICTTLIGLVKLLETQSKSTLVDEAGGIVALMFLVSAVASYSSIRYVKRTGLSQRLEGIADGAFFVGLISLALLAVVFAYELI